jgi:CubicO group peptidase (beta-lactamase class C family)
MAGAKEVAQREGRGWLGPAGGIYSTVNDLLRWDRALADGKVLDSSSRAFMATPRVLASGKSTEYGCGQLIVRTSGEALLDHSGEVSGFYAHNALVLRTRSALVLLSNDDDVDQNPVFDALSRRVFADERPVPTILGPPPEQVARELISQLRRGVLDRSRLSEDYSAFMTEARVRAAHARLEPLGEPSVAVERTSERGGMAVNRLRLTFPTETLKGLLWRSPDGKVQEFFIHP